MRLVTRLSALTVSLAFFAACSSDDTPPTQQQTPTIAVAATTASATAARGASASYPITITRGGGYTGAVTLAATGVPTGVTATFTPSNLGTGVTASTLSLAVGPTAAPGTSTITVTASGSGVTAQQTTVTLTVPTPAITLVAGANTATIVQSATTTIPVTVTRTNGFTGPIDVAVTGLPAGITAGPLSIADGATTGTLTLTASAAAVASATPVNITLTASGTGVTAQTATVALTVNAAATPGFTLTAAPAALSATAGQGGTSTVTLARTGGFAGNIALTVEGAPAGVTATLNPTSLTGTATTSTLTLASTGATVPGTYNLTVRGTSAGQTDRTAVVAFTVNAAPGITVALAPAALSVVQGANATSTITLARVGGLTGDIALTATGLPTGATIAFAPATVTGTTTTSVATLTAGAATPAGTYNVVITGTGTGGVVGTQTLAFTVTSAQGITVAATNASAAQGATGTSTLTLTRTGGFAGAATFAVTGLPNGVTTSFAPNGTTGNTSTLTITVPNTVPTGTYTGTITTTASGVTVPNATFTLTVTTPPIGGTVGYRFCAQNVLPVFFAYRNGTSGTWQPVSAGANNTYTFTFTGNTGAVAFGQPNAAGGVDMTVLYLTAAEVTTYANNACVSNPATRSVTGTVAGLTSTTTPQVTSQSALVNAGTGTAASVTANGNFTIANATDGTVDVVAVRSTQTLGQTGVTIVPDRVIVRRAQNTATGLGAVYDFGSAEAVVPASATYTVNNVGGDVLTVTNAFTTTNGGSGSFSAPFAVSGNTATVYGVPSSLTASGDFQRTLVSAINTSGAVSGIRTVFQFNRDIAARTVTLGDPLLAPAFTPSVLQPYLRIRVQGNWQSEYGDLVSTVFSQGGGSTAIRSWTILASRGYLGASLNTFDFEIPDLTGVAGFNNSWGLVSGTPTSYVVSAYNGFQGISTATEGSAFKVAARAGTLNF